MDEFDLNDALVVVTTNQGLELHATLVRLSRFVAVFEIYQASSILQTSEALQSIRITLCGRIAYNGRATVQNLIDTGLMTLCEVALEEQYWHDFAFTSVETCTQQLSEEVTRFLAQWHKVYRIHPEYKSLAIDIQLLLSQLRLWLEQIEVSIRACPSNNRLALERKAADRLQPVVFPVLDRIFQQLESLTARMEPPFQAAHRAFIKRQLHPFLLSAPFAFRSIQKPLGYAGDYEIVNMILRDPHEGSSFFAKLLNRWFVSQPPAEAHRNRITYLTEKLVEETARNVSHGSRTRVFNLGCGPAQEVQRFITDHELSNRADFTLLDFNEETLAFAQNTLLTLKRQHQRQVQLNFVKKSVSQILKGKTKSAAYAAQHDFIYCAGLFDYLTDAACLQLMNIFYDMLAPGGLLIATNVDTSNPIRHWLSDILEWHLLYRDARQLQQLCPAGAHSDQCRIHSDFTGVNLFLEVRKPTS